MGSEALKGVVVLQLVNSEKLLKCDLAIVSSVLILSTGSAVRDLAQLFSF